MIKVNGIKITDYRVRIGKKYANNVLGTYKAANGTVYSITASRFIDNITEDFKMAARLYNKKGVDDAASEAKAFAKALWGWYGYTYKDSNPDFGMVMRTGSSAYGSFKNATGGDNPAALEWACNNPVKYTGGMIDVEITGGITSAPSTTGIFPGDMSGILKYLLLGLGIVLIIKGIKK